MTELVDIVNPEHIKYLNRNQGGAIHYAFKREIVLK